MMMRTWDGVDAILHPVLKNRTRKEIAHRPHVLEFMSPISLPLLLHCETEPRVA